MFAACCAPRAGNGGCTLIMAHFARRLGLLDVRGLPRQARVRYQTVRGVVAGATERIPLMTLPYELRGVRKTVTAGVSEAGVGGPPLASALCRQCCSCLVLHALSHACWAPDQASAVLRAGAIGGCCELSAVPLESADNNLALGCVHAGATS